VQNGRVRWRAKVEMKVKMKMRVSSEEVTHTARSISASVEVATAK
jgi:hypothetical protein